jgi:hypothetical protein
VSTTSAMVDIHPSVFPTELAERSGDSRYPPPGSSLAVGEDSIRNIHEQSTFRQTRRVLCDVADRLVNLDASGVGLQLVSTGARNQSYGDGAAVLQFVAVIDKITFFKVMIPPSRDYKQWPRGWVSCSDTLSNARTILKRSSDEH